MEDFGTVNLDDYEAEVDRLRRDRNTLIMEIPKLRQKQQDSMILLDAVTERIQRSDSWQQQTMALLAMALKEPSLIEQLVSVNGSGKRRRLAREMGSDSNKEMETVLSVIENDEGSSSMDPRNEVVVESAELTGVEVEQADQEEIEVPVKKEESEACSSSQDVQDLVEKMGKLDSKA